MSEAKKVLTPQIYTTSLLDVFNQKVAFNFFMMVCGTGNVSQTDGYQLRNDDATIGQYAFHSCPSNCLGYYATMLHIRTRTHTHTHKSQVKLFFFGIYFYTKAHGILCTLTLFRILLTDWNIRFR